MRLTLRYWADKTEYMLFILQLKACKTSKLSLSHSNFVHFEQVLIDTIWFCLFRNIFKMFYFLILVNLIPRFYLLYWLYNAFILQIHHLISNDIQFLICQIQIAMILRHYLISWLFFIGQKQLFILLKLKKSKVTISFSLFFSLSFLFFKSKEDVNCGKWIKTRLQF